MISEFSVVSGYLLRQRDRQGCFDNPAPDLFPGAGQLFNIVDIQRSQRLVNTAFQPVLFQKQPKGVGSRREPFRHTDAGRIQLADHLTQRRVFATHYGYSIHTECRKCDNVFRGHDVLTVSMDVLYIRLLDIFLISKRGADES